MAAATLTVVAAGAAADTLVLPPSASADADGQIRSLDLHDKKIVGIVRAAGHVPCAIQDPPDGATVSLLPAASIGVTLVDTFGRQVTETGVVLTTDGTSTDFLATESLPIGIGHPLAQRPRWVGQTNGNGQYLFDELPPGRFFVSVVHPLWIPLQDLGANSPLQVPVGPTNITIVVDEMYGVVFEVPNGETIESNFRTPIDGLNLLPQVTSRIPLAREWLAARHPGCLVYVHRPLRPERGDVSVRCEARSGDGTRWRGEGPLQPLRQASAPIFLERDDRPTRGVVIDLEDSAGTRFDGVPLVLSGPGGTIHMTTGERLSVPHGAYRVTPKILSKALYAAFRDLEIRIDAASPDRFVANSTEPLVEVIIRPRLPSGIARSPVEFYLQNEHGEGPSVVNWLPGHGPIRRLLAAKQISLQVRSVAYRDVDVPPAEVVHGKPKEIVVELEEREPK